MALVVKSKRRHGSSETIVTYRLFGVLPVFRLTRPSRSGHVHLSLPPSGGGDAAPH